MRARGFRGAGLRVVDTKDSTRDFALQYFCIAWGVKVSDVSRFCDSPKP